MEKNEMLNKYEEIRKDNDLIVSINRTINEIKRGIETRDQSIDELIYSSDYYNKYAINSDNSELDSNEIDDRNQEVFDTVYNFISSEFAKENIEAKYNESKQMYLFEEIGE